MFPFSSYVSVFEPILDALTVMTAALDVDEMPNACIVVLALMAFFNPVAMLVVVSPPCTVYVAIDGPLASTGLYADSEIVFPAVAVPPIVRVVLPLVLLPAEIVAVAPALVEAT